MQDICYVLARIGYHHEQHPLCIDNAWYRVLPLSIVEAMAPLVLA